MAGMLFVLAMFAFIGIFWLTCRRFSPADSTFFKVSTCRCCGKAVSLIKDYCPSLWQ